MALDSLRVGTVPTMDRYKDPSMNARKRARTPSWKSISIDDPELATPQLASRHASSSSSSSSSAFSPPDHPAVDRSSPYPWSKRDAGSSSYFSIGKGKRRAITIPDDDDEDNQDEDGDAFDASMLLRTVKPSVLRHRHRSRSPLSLPPHETSRYSPIKSPRIPPQRCKFAKAGCPFVGPPGAVAAHESSYCTPLYTQLAHYKTLASQSASLLPGSTAKTEAGTSRDDDPQALQVHIARLHSDLARVQKELENEKRLRTERLRRASERCMELMSLSELGEGKVEVLKLQLRAERELREKLEEELESMRSAL